MIIKTMIMAFAIPWARCRQTPAYNWPTGPAGADAGERSWTSVDGVTSGFPTPEAAFRVSQGRMCRVHCLP